MPFAEPSKKIVQVAPFPASNPLVVDREAAGKGGRHVEGEQGLGDSGAADPADRVDHRPRWDAGGGAVEEERVDSTIPRNDVLGPGRDPTAEIGEGVEREEPPAVVEQLVGGDVGVFTSSTPRSSADSAEGRVTRCAPSSSIVAAPAVQVMSFETSTERTWAKPACASSRRAGPAMHP